ncbi:hypothetical protein [Clostridium sp.]|uniref:hypothetical protein n=1 Tax=Clostridium sp. TaxID=1506 RepID=UPI003D6D2D51
MKVGVTIIGIKDFFGGAWEITKAVGELGSGLTKLAVESSAELGEIMTDGFNEMVIKDNKGYETSYEIKEKAENKMAAAKNRWCLSESNALKKIEQTKSNIARSYENKRRLAIKIGENIGKQNPLINSTETIRISEPFCSEFDKKFEFFLSTNVGIMGIGSRKKIANEYLDDARDYSIAVNEKIAKLDGSLMLLEKIDYQIIEETRLLQILEKAMIEQKNINYNNAYEIIKDMLKNEISNESGIISSQYIKDFERLKILCVSM